MKNFEYISADKLGELLKNNEVTSSRVGIQYNDDESEPQTTTVLILTLYNGKVLAIKLAEGAELYEDLDFQEENELYR